MILFRLILICFVTCFLSCKNAKPIITANAVAMNLTSGKIMRVENFPSKFVTSRHVDIWLPNDYSESKTYAVLYMHDGKMLFDGTDTWNHQEWGIDEAMLTLVSSGIIRDVIVVGVWNVPEERHADYFPQKAFDYLSESDKNTVLADAGKSQLSIAERFSADNYLKFLVKELKPFIDTTFSTHSDLQNTFIAGSSMGGLISMYAVCEYPEVFGGAACLSTHWPGVAPSENNPVPDAIFKYMNDHMPKADKHKMYFDYGTETLDTYYQKYAPRVDVLMVLKGYEKDDFKNLKFIGDAHDENSWQNRIDQPLTFLLSKYP